MILSKDSYFRRPPKVFSKDQVVIFNSISYCLDICDLAFERLKDNCYKLIYSTDSYKPTFPFLFSDVWTIIQNSSIFMKLLKTHFNIDIKEPLLDEIRDVKSLRDTSQHIDERLTEVLLKKELPTYGVLSWFSREHIDSNDGIIAICYPGTFTDKNSINAFAVTPKDLNLKQKVFNIEFTGIIRPKPYDDYFEKNTVIIDKLIEGTENIIINLEKQIDNRVKDDDIDVTERHRSDILITDFVKIIS